MWMNVVCTWPDANMPCGREVWEDVGSVGGYGKGW